VGELDIGVNNAGYFPTRSIDDLDLPTGRKTSRPGRKITGVVAFEHLRALDALPLLFKRESFKRGVIFLPATAPLINTSLQ
jgi:hypothetical protein